MSDKGNDVNYLELPDEELMNMPAPAFEEVEQEVPEKKEADEQVDEDDESTGSDDDEAGDADEKDAEDDSEEGETPDPAEAAADAGDEAKPDDEKAKEGKKVDKPKDETPALNYEQEYKRLMGTFKANGRDITPKSVEDAISLMQMGANYNKKMAALKPNLRLMKMLENNKLLDEDKLSFLIDLDKRKPEAISKLVKDSGLDHMDLDAEKADGYQKTSYAVDEKELDLDQVLDDLKETPTYSRTLKVIGDEWDSPSKQIVAQQPELLRVINDHIGRGIYDQINQEIENERAFGRLTGLSFLEAYRQVGDAIQARGGFNHLMRDQGKSQTTDDLVLEPKSKKADEERIRQKRKAAGPTKPSAPKSGEAEFNPLALSDEEFMKLSKPKYV